MQHLPCWMPKGFTCELANLSSEHEQMRIQVFCTSPLCTVEKCMHPLCLLRWEQALMAVLMKTTAAFPFPCPGPLAMGFSARHLEVLAQLSQCPCGEGCLSRQAPLSPYPQQFHPPLQHPFQANKLSTVHSRTGVTGEVPAVAPRSVSLSYSTCLGRQRTLSSSSTVSTSIPSPSPFNDSGFFDYNSSFASSLAELPPSTPSLPNSGKLCQSQQGMMPNKRVRHRTTSGHHSTSTSSISSGLPGCASGSAEVLPENMSISGGNIFHRRADYDVFLQLPREKQNAYFICMEDDGCNGNDEAKAFLLSKLTTFRANTTSCLLCHRQLPIYDHFPLLDGAFFFSPVCHDANSAFPIAMPSNSSVSPMTGAAPHRPTAATTEVVKYLHAVCMGCMHGSTSHALQCRSCSQAWSGARLIVGGVYQFDILAGLPCCSQRVSCKACGSNLQTVVDASGARAHCCSFYSEALRCPTCARRDYHFVRPLWDVFTLVSESAPPSCAAAAATGLVTSSTNSGLEQVSQVLAE